MEKALEKAIEIDGEREKDGNNVGALVVDGTDEGHGLPKARACSDSSGLDLNLKDIGDLEAQEDTDSTVATIMPAEWSGDEERAEVDAEENLVWWDGPDDPENPRNWTARTRWGIMTLVSLITFITYVSFPVRFWAYIDTLQDH